MARIKSDRFLLSEKFYSIQGEGKTTGYPSYFIRLSQCNLTCGCSSTYVNNLKKLDDPLLEKKPGSFKGDLHEDGKATWTCFVSNTKINTERGRINIQDLKVGDTVLSFNETTGLVENSTIIRIGSREVTVEDLIKIELEHGSFLVCTKDHPFYVKGRWKQAQSLLAYDEIYSIPYAQYQSIVSKHRYDNYTIQQRNNISEQVKRIDKSYMQTEEYKRAHQEGQKKIDWATVSERMKKNNPMKNPKTVKKNWEAHQRRMSKLEIRFQKLVQRYDLPIEYVGNGKFWIENQNPDFKVIGENKVIELYDSSYKPNNGYMRDSNWEMQRSKKFIDANIQVLFINVYDEDKNNSNWTLEKQQEIARKVQKFCLNGKKVLSTSQYTGRKKIVYILECDNNKNYFANGCLAHNCDTIPVWIKGQEVQFQDIIDGWKEQGIYNDIKSGLIHIIWTGGEPLIQQDSIVEFMRYWQLLPNIKPGELISVYNEIETNGTLYINDDLFNILNQINCSPKLSNSGQMKSMRINEKSIKRIMDHPNYQFKFVISTEDDIFEMFDTYINPFNIPLKNVVCMPGLDNRDDFFERTKWVMEMAKKYKFIGLSRMHVASWNQLTGV